MNRIFQITLRLQSIKALVHPAQSRASPEVDRNAFLGVIFTFQMSHIYVEKILSHISCRFFKKKECFIILLIKVTYYSAFTFVIQI